MRGREHEYCLEVAARLAEKGNSSLDMSFEYAQIWSMLALSVDLTRDKLHHWDHHPLGAGIVNSAISFFEEQKNY